MRIKYLVLVIILSVSNAFAQDGNSQDVIYLKNGRVVKGTIVEKSPGGKLTIRTWSGYKFTYKKSEISKIEKEETGKDEEQADQNESKPTTKNRGHVIDNLYGDSKYFIQVSRHIQKFSYLTPPPPTPVPPVSPICFDLEITIPLELNFIVADWVSTPDPMP